MTTYAPNPILIEPATDFTGGLNYRADAFQLDDRESPDMLNVDLDPRGGFASRDGVAVMNATALTNPPKAIWQFSTTGGTKQVLVQNSITTTNQIAWSTGGNFTLVSPDALACTGTMRATTFKDNCYIQRDAQQAVVKWTGAAATVLGTTFNDNFAAPTGGNMPKARVIASHGGYVWVANTLEGATSFKSRVRWSHPNQPEDFRTNDFIDIDTGHDGDEITALVPYGDRLLVFKANSMHMIMGFDFNSFAVQPVSQAVGAISQEATCTSDYGVYFFSWPDGLMHYTGSPPETAFERLWPAIADGRINSSSQAGISVAYLNRRVWVSVPFGTSTNSRVFILDPSLQWRRRYGSPKQRLAFEGGWTAYDLPLGPMLEWQPPGAAATFLGCHATLPRVMKLHQATATDDFGAGAVNINTYYVTRWFSANNPATLKRWKRPEIVMRANGMINMTIDVWHDYNTSNIKRTIPLVTSTPAVGGLVWDVGSWDVGSWAGDSTQTEEIHRVSALGRSRATRLRINGPVPSVGWAIDSITFKYIPRRVRA